MKLLAALAMACVMAALGVLAVQGRPESPPPAVNGAAEPLVHGDYLVAAPGRVEPASEEITVGAPISGLLKKVLVKEGDHVAAGEVVAVLDTDLYRAAVARSTAELALRREELSRLMNGARPEERAASQAALDEADAVMKNAAAALARRRPLLKQGNLAQEAFDRAEETFIVARQRRAVAAQRFALIDGKPRAEDIAIAKARIALAQADCDKAQAALDQAMIRSPIDGTVLRVSRHAGEVLSLFVDPAVMTIGDIARLNVRADVDEADIGKLKVGMPAYVTAEAYGDRRFPGRILRIGRMLGKKTIRTDEPTERLDTKVLEVVIALDPADRLLPGLRVNAFILPPAAADAAGRADPDRLAVR